MNKIVKNFFHSLVSNLKSILMAVVVSVIIWFAVSLQIFPDVTLHIHDIPIQIIPTQLMGDQNLQIRLTDSDKTSVQIQGKRYVIGQLTNEDFDAYLDLSNITGKGIYEVDTIVTAKEDDKCTVIPGNEKRLIEVEKISTKTLEISVKADTINVVDGLQIDSVNLACNPPTVTITGEESLIDSIKTAEAVVTYDGELLTSTELKGELILYNNSKIKVENPDISFDNTYFSVTVPVHKTKLLPLDFEITGYPSNFDIETLKAKINITPKEVTISSPNNSIDSLTTLDVGEMALSDITYKVLNGYTRDTIAPWLAEGYRIVSGNVSYSLSFTEIENYISRQFTLTKENFRIVNQPFNYDVDILTSELIVNVVGPSDHVQALTVDDISITVNLGGIEISEGAKTIKASLCRINGTNVPSWITDNPQIDLYFRLNN